MPLHLEQLLGDARRLSCRLREHDSAADAVLGLAQATLKDVEAMKQYQEDLEQLNAIAHHRPRAQLVLGIQQENRHIRQLQHENKELRATLEEHQNAIELIMSKYRQQMNILVHSTKLDKNVVNERKAQLLQDKTDQIFEMASIMQNSIKLDEENEVQDREIRTRLLTENRGLRELLLISRRNGSVKQSLNHTKYISQECQTEDISAIASPRSSGIQPTTELAMTGENPPTNPLNNTNKMLVKTPSTQVSPTSPIRALVRNPERSEKRPNSFDSQSQVELTNTNLSYQSSDEDVVSSDEEVIFNTIKRTPAKAREIAVDFDEINRGDAKCNGNESQDSADLKSRANDLTEETSNVFDE